MNVLSICAVCAVFLLLSPPTVSRNQIKGTELWAYGLDGGTCVYKHKMPLMNSFFKIRLGLCVCVRVQPFRLGTVYFVRCNILRQRLRSGKYRGRGNGKVQRLAGFVDRYYDKPGIYVAHVT